MVILVAAGNNLGDLLICTAGATAIYTSGGLDHYRHPDCLGSARLSSSTSRSATEFLSYAPFGDIETQGGTANPSFTGQNQDAVASLYDIPAREYDPLAGRWPEPDPAGLAAVDLANPQSWNRYAYVLNSPLNLIDPSGMVTVPDYRSLTGGGGLVNIYWALGFANMGNCTMDGMVADCGATIGILQGEGAVQCPANNCGIGTATPYQCLESVCGYMSIQYATSHENEWNGQLYTDAEFVELEMNAIDAQQRRLADAIVAAAAGAGVTLQWLDVYNELTPLYTKGGNTNFSYSGILPFLPRCSNGGELSDCRTGEFPSIHYAGEYGPYPILHLDAGNPFYDLPFGLSAHLGDLLGMVNSSVPFGTANP